MPARISLVLSRNGLREATTLSSVLGAEEILELAHELAHVTERAIDGGKAHVGDLVEALQLLHHDGPDFFGAHLLFRTILESRLDLVGHRLDGGDADRPLLTRLEEARHQLLPLEPFARAVLLDHHVRNLVDPLVAGEPAPAVETLAAAANHFALLAFARVDDLIAEMCAERALHQTASLPARLCARNRQSSGDCRSSDRPAP